MHQEPKFGWGNKVKMLSSCGKRGRDTERKKKKQRGRKQRRKYTLFDFLTEDVKLKAFFYSLLFTTIFHSIKLYDI